MINKFVVMHILLMFQAFISATLPSYIALLVHCYVRK